MSEVTKCVLCGEPMPPGEQMFKFHGYSCPCPKPPLPVEKKLTYEELEQQFTTARELLREMVSRMDDECLTKSFIKKWMELAKEIVK